MPNISVGKLHQLESAQKELDDIRIREALRPFVDEMLECIGISLAMTPYENWPTVARSAFEYMATKNPMLAHEYKRRLRQ